MSFVPEIELGCSRQMLSDLFQKQYDFEHQRRSELTAATAPLIGANTVLSGALSVALLDYPYSKSISATIFVLFTAGTLAALGFSVLSVFRSTWNYVYQKLAPAPALEKYAKNLNEWHLAQGANDAEAKILSETDLKEYVAASLSKAADWNGQNNERRGNFLHMGTTSIAIALSLFIPAAMLYAYAKSKGPEKIYRVQLMATPSQLSESTMTTRNTQSTPAAAPAPAPSAPASAPSVSQSKPVGPDNAQFRTNTQIPSPRAGSKADGKSGL